MKYKSIHLNGYKKTVPSENSPDTFYEVEYGESKYDNPQNTHDWSCTCPYWVNRCYKSGKYCKHILKTIKNGDMVAWEGEIPYEEYDKELIETLLALVNTNNEDTLDIGLLKDLSKEIIKSKQYYVPFQKVKAVLDSEELGVKILSYEGKKVIIMADGNNSDDLVRGGALSSEIWGFWYQYQENKSEELKNVCQEIGFDPDYFYLLSPDKNIKDSSPCAECGGKHTEVVINQNNNRFCTNALCEKSVNNISAPHYTTGDNVTGFKISDSKMYDKFYGNTDAQKPVAKEATSKTTSKATSKATVNSLFNQLKK